MFRLCGYFAENHCVISLYADLIYKMNIQHFLCFVKELRILQKKIYILLFKTHSGALCYFAGRIYINPDKASVNKAFEMLIQTLPKRTKTAPAKAGAEFILPS